MNDIDYKAVIEIIENFLNSTKVEILGISVGEENKLRQAIENLLKERQEDKERIKELKEENRIQQKQINSAFDRGYIAKSLVREKIELLKQKREKYPEYSYAITYSIDRLKELL